MLFRSTRAIIDAIIDGSIEKAETINVPILNLVAPKSLPGVSDILDPRNTYSNVSEWEEKAKSLAAKYIKNFEQYLPEGANLLASGPKL